MKGFSFTVRAGSQDWQKQGWDEITGSWRGLKSLAVSGDLGLGRIFSPKSAMRFVWSSLPPMGAGISYKIKKGLLKLVFAAGVRLVQIWAGERRGIGRVREGSSIRNHQSTAMPHCIEGIPQIFHLLGTLKLWTCPPPKLLLAFTVAHFADGYIQSNLEDHKSLLYISIGFFSLGVKVMVLCFLVPQSAKWSQMFYTDTFWLNSK